MKISTSICRPSVLLIARHRVGLKLQSRYVALVEPFFVTCGLDVCLPITMVPSPTTQRVDFVDGSRFSLQPVENVFES